MSGAVENRIALSQVLTQACCSSTASPWNDVYIEEEGETESTRAKLSSTRPFTGSERSGMFFVHHRRREHSATDEGAFRTAAKSELIRRSVTSK